MQAVTNASEYYLRPALIGLKAKDWKTMYRVMNRDIQPGLGSGQPIAKAAIDMALHESDRRRRAAQYLGIAYPAERRSDVPKR